MDDQLEASGVPQLVAAVRNWWHSFGNVRMPRFPWLRVVRPIPLHHELCLRYGPNTSGILATEHQPSHA